MSYNNQYNGYGNRYGFSPYRSNGWNNGGGGYNRGFNRGGNYRPQQRQQKKHSGCKFGYSNGDQERPHVRGWKFDKTHGMRAFIAGPNKKTKRTTSRSGQTWENWTVKVTGPHGVQLYNALYHHEKKRVYINDLGIVMSPNGGSGGYVGPYFRRKNR
ncbi:MAG: hypothetical protein J0H92_07885 [Sphingobacteriales bacterium]|nr:hypothetical protein [Sphingobacteriales bacterium]OJW30086.1 MAG: hypothetical protein BGO54_00375 [Sphingobacteriales bacterium 46-32]